MTGYGLFGLILGLVVFEIRCLQAEICVKISTKGCDCYKEVKDDRVYVGDTATELRHVPVACRKPCAFYRYCTERDERQQQIRSCPGVTMVTRQQWGAKNATGPIGVIHAAVDQFYIHHTGKQDCSDFESCAKLLRAIQNYHFSEGWYDIGYSFLVGEDGNIYEGRGWNKVGAHTEGFNSVSYAASFMGNYMSKLPNNKAMSAAQQLILCGIELGKIRSVYSLYGHRDADGDTDCPGNSLYKEIHGWKYYNRTANPSAGCVARGRRCKGNVDTCKSGSLVVGPNLCKGGNKNCCLKP